jgi:hypothetical protein
VRIVLSCPRVAGSARVGTGSYFTISIHSRLGGEYLVDLAGQTRPGLLIKDLGFSYHPGDRAIQGAAGAAGGVGAVAAGGAGAASKLLAAKYVRRALRPSSTSARLTATSQIGSWGITALTGGTGAVVILGALAGHAVVVGVQRYVPPSSVSAPLADTLTAVGAPQVVPYFQTSTLDDVVAARRLGPLAIDDIRISMADAHAARAAMR